MERSAALSFEQELYVYVGEVYSVSSAGKPTGHAYGSKGTIRYGFTQNSHQNIWSEAL